MSKTFSQMKNMIEDWIKVTNVEYRDTTEEIQKKVPKVEWQIIMQKVIHVTAYKGREDRVNLHTQTSFDSKLSSKLTVGIDEVENIVQEINAFLITNGLRFEWKVKEKLITGFVIKSSIDSEILDRPHFFYTWDRILSATSHVSGILMRLVKQSQTQTSADSSASTMYQ